MKVIGHNLINYNPADNGGGNLTQVIDCSGNVIHRHCILLNIGSLNLPAAAGIDVGDIIPLRKVRTGSKLINFSIEALNPFTDAAGDFSFTGTFGAIDERYIPSTQGDVSDFVPFTTADGAVIGGIVPTICSHLWFTNITQREGDANQCREAPFVFSGAVINDGEDFDVGKLAGFKLLSNVKSSFFMCAAREMTVNEAANGADIAAARVGAIFKSAYGEVTVGMQLEMALCDGLARNGTVQGAIDYSGAYGPCIVNDGTPDANGLQHYINYSYQKYRSASEVWTALVVHEAIPADKVNQMNIVVTFDEIRDEASFTTSGANVRGYRLVGGKR